MPEVAWSFASLVIGSFLGASLAFGFERRQRLAERFLENYSKAKYAHFILVQQYSELRDLLSQYLRPEIPPEHRWWSLQPLLNPPRSFLLDFDSLAFVLRSRDPDLLNRLAVTQHRFSTIVSLLDQRSRLHAQLQERISILQRGGVNISGKMFLLDEASIDLIGRDLVTQLQGATAYLFEGIPVAQREISARLEELQYFVKEEFPKERVPSFQLVLPLSNDQSAEH